MNRSLAKLRNFCKTIDRSQDALVTNVRLHFDRPILRIVNEPKGFYRFHRRSIWFRTLSAFVLFFFCSHILFENIALLGVAKAEADPSSNFPHLLSLSTPFSYPTLRGIKTCSSQPFDLDILLDAQDNESVAKGEAEKLIRYFLSMLTIPEQEVWVNLSPYENDRITSSSLEWTEAGRDLLRQDYLLKRLSASLSYPESDTGKIYWEKVYRKAYETFGTTKIPINTFNKIWIVPEKAVVFDFGDSAVVGPTRLKVLLEEDYLALMKNTKKIEGDLTSSSEKAQSLNNISAAAFREVIIPILEKEVNEGEQFAATRQVFHSLILAIWFKNNLKRNIINNIYADQRKVAGVDKSGPKDKERIYQDYLMVFKEGVYNYRKRDYDAHLGKSILRQYYSGGIFGSDSKQWLTTFRVTDVNTVQGALRSFLSRKWHLAKIRLHALKGEMAKPSGFGDNPGRLRKMVMSSFLGLMLMMPGQFLGELRAQPAASPRSSNAQDVSKKYSIPKQDQNTSKKKDGKSYEGMQKADNKNPSKNEFGNKRSADLKTQEKKVNQPDIFDLKVPELPKELLKEKPVSLFSRIKIALFDLLALLVILRQAITNIWETKRKNVSENNNFFRYVRRLFLPLDRAPNLLEQFSNWIARFTDLSAKRVGENVTISLTELHAFNGNQKRKDDFVRQLTSDFDSGRLRVRLNSSVPVDLEWKSIDLSDGKANMVFKIPSSAKVGKSVTFFYQENDEINSVDIPLSHDDLQELVDQWQVLLRSSDPIRVDAWQSLVEEISLFRKRNPIDFYNFRRHAAHYYRIRELALQSVQRIKAGGSEDHNLIEYFNNLGVYSNHIRYLMAQSAGLDRYKSRFLSANDQFSFKFFSLFPLDKIFRIVFLIEYFYQDIKNKALNLMPEVFRYRQALDTFESKVPHDHQLEQDYSVQSMKRDFEMFSYSMEHPFEQSAVGRDKLRRHTRLFNSFFTLFSLASSIALLSLSSVLSIFITVALVARLVFYYYLFPVFINFNVEREFNRFQKELNPKSQISLETDDQVAEEKDELNQLLKFISSHLIFDHKRSTSRFILEAKKVEEVTCTRVDEHIIVDFVADGYIRDNVSRRKRILEAAKSVVFAGYLRFLDDNGREFMPSEIIAEVNDSEVSYFLRVDDDRVEPRAIRIVFGVEPHEESYEMPVKIGRYQNLINRWRIFLNKKEISVSLLDVLSLVDQLRFFRSSKSLKLKSFRKNAVMYHEIREMSLATYERLINHPDENLRIFAQYFRTLAEYSNEVRLTMADISTMDTLKSRFFPENQSFGRRILGVRADLLLRSAFGVSFVYHWAENDALKSIQRIARFNDQLEDQERRMLSLPAEESQQHHLDELRRLTTDFEQMDLSFRQPSRNSLVGGDLVRREQRMGIMLVSLAMVALKVFTIFIPAELLNTPLLRGMTVFDLSFLYFIIVYWINPIHSQNEVKREYMNFKKRISGDMQPMPEWIEKFRQYAHVVSYVLGIFEPTVILFMYFYQQLVLSFREKSENGGDQNKDIDNDDDGETRKDLNKNLADDHSQDAGRSERDPMMLSHSDLEVDLIEQRDGGLEDDSMQINDAPYSGGDSKKPFESRSPVPRLGPPGGIDLHSTERLLLDREIPRIEQSSQHPLFDNNKFFMKDFRGFDFRWIGFAPISSPRLMLDELFFGARKNGRSIFISKGSVPNDDRKLVYYHVN